MFCKNCNNEFTITDEDRKFYAKIDVPEPIFCPDCRLQNRLAWRNELKLYPTKCAMCGIEMVSTISPNWPYQVYCRGCYWSDKWDPRDYGRDFDFSRHFFEQFNELILQTPTVHIFGGADNVNSTYANYALSLKNCYMYCAGGWNEDEYYSFFGTHNKDCCDCMVIFDSELCYELVDSEKCYNVNFSEQCQNCLDGSFLYDCRNCKNCWCSANLRNAEYVFLNKQLDKDTYQRKILEIKNSSYQEIEKWREEFLRIKNEAIKPAQISAKSEDCEGQYVVNSARCKNAYTVSDSEDLNYCVYNIGMKDAMDCVQAGVGGELAYEIATGGMSAYNIAFGVVVRECTDVWYSYICHNSKDLFGCSNMNKQKFCIFNKQYSEKEYYKLKERIIEHMKKTGEWGRMFPAEYSPFGYNETVAQEFFPLDKTEVENRGWKWQNNLPGTFGRETVRNIPDEIQNVSDGFTEEVLACSECKRNYKLIRQELEFYQRKNLPIPRKCFSCRHLDRLNMRRPYKMIDANCGKCGRQVVTSGEISEKVYCEECYQKEIY